MPVIEIGAYQVQYAANTFVPRIWLKDKSNANIGQLIFKPDGSPLPPDNATNLYYHLSDYPHIMDLMRNEKPLFWHFAGSGPGFENAVRTSIEPQGESEHA